MRDLLRSETGIALPLAAGVLLTLSLLVVAVVNTSMQSTSSANKDRNVKRALAAAEAGLQTASNRLNLASPEIPSGMCLGDGPVAPSGGECPGFTMDLGNDARFTYWVTPALNSGRDCSGDPNCAERVITSVGDVKGEIRRIQMRVESEPAHIPYFPIRGIYGDNSVTFYNGARIDGAIGSDGRITAHNNSTATILEPLAGGPAPAWRGSTPIVPRSEPITLPAVPIEGTEDHNVNFLIATNARVRYEPNRRDLYLDSGTLLLPPGDYNFCRFIANNDATIRVLGPVRIFIDNGSRADSGCPRGGDWGSFRMRNKAFINPAPSPTVNFQLFVHGGGEVDFMNDAVFNGSIFAPDSFVDFKNAASFTGAISARDVDFNNDPRFTYHDGFDSVGGSQGEFRRESWVECRPRPMRNGDPESGC